MDDHVICCIFGFICCDDSSFGYALSHFHTVVSMFLFFLVFYCCGGECKGVFPPPYDSVSCSLSTSWYFLFPFGNRLCWGRFLVIDLGCRLYIRDQYGIASGR